MGLPRRQTSPRNIDRPENKRHRRTPGRAWYWTLERTLSVTLSSVKVVDPPPAHTRANSKKPAAVPNAITATFNPSQHRVTTRLLVTAWCLPT